MFVPPEDADLRDGGTAPECWPSPDAQRRYDQVTYHFYGSVDARGSTFGTSYGGRSGGHRVRRHPTGTLSEAEALATVSNYVRPPGFDDVVKRLCQDHLAVVRGGVGSGRQAGAVASLREVTDGPVTVLPCGTTMRDLVEWDYGWGCGYVLLDGEALESDVGWTEVAERVKRAGAYLVVTATVDGPTAATSGPHESWERPPAADVLRGHLSRSSRASDVEDLVSLLVTDLPPEFPLARLAQLAKLINEGNEPAQAIDQLHEASEHQIRRWLEQRRSSREIAELTALAFLSGTSEPTFDSQLRRLEELFAENQPLRLRERASPTEESGGTRSRYRLAEQNLMSIERPVPSAGTARVVGFREQRHQRSVLSYLQRTCDGRFWDAVRDWINRMVLEEDRVEVASGLAWLAYTDFDDVRESFLEPWSLRRFGWSGQATAAYVLWCMCREESTARRALETAVQWSRSDDVNQRATAMIAFSGELGVCYPTEAVRRLWQMTTQTEDLCSGGCAALARLFAVLADQTGQAELLLGMVDRQWAQPCQTNEEHRLRRRTVAATLAILTVRSHRSGSPAIIEFFRTRPDQRRLVVRLWAAVLRSQRGRWEGLVALWRALQGLHYIDNGSLGGARSLGWAFAEVLLSYERPLLRTDLVRLDLELCRERGDPVTAELNVFLAQLNEGDESRSPYGSEL